MSDEGELVAGHDLSDGGLDEGGAEARQDRRGAAEDGVKEDLRLGEVGDLRRAADGGEGGQQEILKDGAQQGVGAEALGGGVEDGEQVGGGVLRLAGEPASVFAAERRAGAGGFVQKEEQAAAGSDEDLGVVAAFGEELVAFVKGGLQFLGVLEGMAQHGRAQGVEGAGGGVDDDEAEVGEGGGQEAGERRGEGGVRAYSRRRGGRTPACRR